MTFPFPFPMFADTASGVSITAQGSNMTVTASDSTSHSMSVDIGTDSGIVVLCAAVTGANIATSSITACTVDGNSATIEAGCTWWNDEEGGIIAYVDVGSATGSVTVSITTGDALTGAVHFHAFRVAGSTGSPVDSTVTTANDTTNPRTTSANMSCSAGGGMIGFIANRNRDVDYSSPSFTTGATTETDGGANRGTAAAACADFATAQTNIAFSITTSNTLGRPYGIAAIAFDPA